MSFTAWYYPFFLCIVTLLFWRLPPRGRLVLLLAASYLFYGVWDLRFLSLIAASTAMDFLCAQAIEGERKPLATLAGLCALPVAWFFLVALAIAVDSRPSIYKIGKLVRDTFKVDLAALLLRFELREQGCGPLTCLLALLCSFDVYLHFLEQ